MMIQHGNEPFRIQDMFPSKFALESFSSKLLRNSRVMCYFAELPIILPCSSDGFKVKEEQSPTETQAQQE